MVQSNTGKVRSSRVEGSGVIFVVVIGWRSDIAESDVPAVGLAVVFGERLQLLVEFLIKPVSKRPLHVVAHKLVVLVAKLGTREDRKVDEEKTEKEEEYKVGEFQANDEYTHAAETQT